MLASCSSRRQIFTCKYWDEATAELMKLRENKPPYLQTFTKTIKLFLSVKCSPAAALRAPSERHWLHCSSSSAQVCARHLHTAPPRPRHRGVATHQGTPTPSLWLAHPLVCPRDGSFQWIAINNHVPLKKKKKKSYLRIIWETVFFNCVYCVYSLLLCIIDYSSVFSTFWINRNIPVHDVKPEGHFGSDPWSWLAGVEPDGVFCWCSSPSSSPDVSGCFCVHRSRTEWLFASLSPSCQLKASLAVLLWTSLLDKMPAEH